MNRFAVVVLSWVATGCLGPYEAPSGPTEVPLPEVRITASVVEDTTWTADNVYVLAQDTIVYVEGTTVLTVEPGTQVLGEIGSALIVSRDAQIVARGEPDNPIVFSSAQPVGSRKTGDWGGVVLLGNDELNKGPTQQIEGIAGEELRAQYGGDDPFDNCGALEYVRIEFAGFELTDGYDGNELNGLTLGGCGVNTFIRYVQVHRGLDDGIELFGGSVDLKFIVVSGAGDDSLDWDEGWDGRVQYGVIQQYPNPNDPEIEKIGDEGFEGDGAIIAKVDVDPKDGLDDVAAPFSYPVISNVTILGSGDQKATAQNAMELKEGTAANLVNLLIARQTGHGVNLKDPQTSAWLDPYAPDGAQLTLRNSVFYAVGADGMSWARDDGEVGGDEDDDGGFDENAWLQTVELANSFNADPALPEPDAAGAWITNPTPLWIPAPGSVAGKVGGTPPTGEFFDSAATFAGAIRPGSEVAWWDGWTAFPEN
ncbi:MAG: hypothetical protein AAGA48_06530 [Myxococcota bacterium]